MEKIIPDWFCELQQKRIYDSLRQQRGIQTACIIPKSTFENLIKETFKESLKENLEIFIENTKNKMKEIFKFLIEKYSKG